MVNRLSHLIENLPHEELVKLRQDLRTGNLDKLIAERLELFEPTKSGLCPVCNGKVSNDHFTLIFGPTTLRQKASFDGVDCLQYFLDRMKD